MSVRRFFVTTLVALSVGVAACDRAPVAGECEGAESRCRGGNLESCTDGRFGVVQNCAASGLECRVTSEGAACAVSGADGAALDATAGADGMTGADGMALDATAGADGMGADGSADGGEVGPAPDATGPGPDAEAEDGGSLGPPSPGATGPYWTPLFASGRSAGGDLVLHAIGAPGQTVMSGGAASATLRLGPLRSAVSLPASD